MNQTESKRNCASVGCSKEASSLKCPKCAEYNLPPSYFCSQECFKSNYSSHNKIHKEHQEEFQRKEALKNYVAPSFKYTGSLRPSYVTPQRIVTNPNIMKPDYADSGYSASEYDDKYQRKIPIYNAQEIKGIREACRLAREVLDIAAKLVRAGITTDEIDKVVHEACLERGCYPSPLNYNQFPKSCCTSVNEVICHGIPDCRPLENGDIVNIDITVYKNGYHGDVNETYLVGDVEQKYKDLVKSTYESMMNAIEHVKPDVIVENLAILLKIMLENQNILL